MTHHERYAHHEGRKESQQARVEEGESREGDHVECRGSDYLQRIKEILIRKW